MSFVVFRCGHCKSLAPEFDKAAQLLKGVAKVVAVDATAHESLAQKYQIQGFPTLKIFGADKKSPIDYQGERTASGIVTEIMRHVNALIKDRTGGGKKDKASAKGEKGSKKEKANKSNVIELTDTNFDALVMESNDHWLVEFYAPWCGHCKKLAPEWEKAANRLKNEGVKVGAIDATAHQALASRYGIKGFPTIKLFPAGPKGAPQDYQGQRESDPIVEFALQTLEHSGAPVQIRELTSPAVFEESCGGKSAKLCAILFLPHILDTGAKGRNDYLELFQDVAKSLRKLPLAYVWTEANAQSNLENSLSINGNFPTVAVLSLEKNIFAVLKLSWNKKNIHSFLNGAITGT
jgi:protein disulfide-isomerase A6